MTGPRVVSESLGGSPLARAVIEGRATGWLAPAPSTAAEWRARAGETASRWNGRDWLSMLQPVIAPTGAAAERLERVAASGGIVVTTGQQPGLFGGPIYTWSKALSALALADAIESATGIATAPLFWAATDDSDFAEAASTVVAVPGGFEVLSLPREPGGDDRMMSHVKLPAMSGLVAQLERGAGSAVHREVIDEAARCYREGATVGGAYVALLRAMLERLGIAVMDASHPAVAAAAAPVLRDALERAEPITAALNARNDELRARGFEPQVALVPGLSLVFRREAGTRTRIPIAKAAEWVSADVELGPNVLLRPIVEQAIVPTVAYAAGPGEIAYFVQTSAVAGALGRPAPVAVPRWSGTIIEPHVQRILDRYGLDADALKHPVAAETALARAATPPDVTAALEEFRARIDELAARLAAGAAGESEAIVTDAVIEGHRRVLRHRVDRLERRLVAGIKRRESATAHDLATARGALFPGGKRQERALNLLPMLARHGPRLLDLMRERAGEHAETLIGGARIPAVARG